MSCELDRQIGPHAESAKLILGQPFTVRSAQDLLPYAKHPFKPGTGSIVTPSYQTGLPRLLEVSVDVQPASAVREVWNVKFPEDSQLTDMLRACGAHLNENGGLYVNGDPYLASQVYVLLSRMIATTWSPSGRLTPTIMTFHADEGRHIHVGTSMPWFDGAVPLSSEMARQDHRVPQSVGVSA